MRRPGFTLMEILVAMSLTGIVTALALAPVVVTVQRVVGIQNSTADTLALSRTTAFIGRDLAGAVRLTQTAVIVEDHQLLGDREDDTLIVMTTAPTRQQMAAGSVVYRIEQGSFMRAGTPAGLYRWLLPGKLPGEFDTKDLRGEDGQLILPGVTAFSVEVVEGKDRTKEYKGALPVGMCVALTRGEKEDEERLEDVLVFP